MRFKSKLFHAAVFAFLGVNTASCGILGHKDDMNKLLNYNPEAVGCMNELGPRFAAYFSGDITKEKWGATWDCATNSLGLFKKFVRTSDPKGYTQDDIRAFISNFLLTNATVTPELVAATFELKASIFGGNKNIITVDELDKVIALLKEAKQQSTKLLPFMVKRVREPTPDNLLDMTDALVNMGDGLSQALHTAGNPMFPWASAQIFANELSKLLNLNLPADAVVWLSAVKVLFAAGAREGIEAEAWPRVLRAAVAYGGPALAAFSVEAKYLRGPNATGEFGMKLAWKIKSSLTQTFDLYQGALPLKSLDQVIDALPEKWLTTNREAIKKSLRPIAKKILGSRVDEAIDQSALDLVFNKIDFWNRGQTHLEKIYDRMHADSSGVTAERFAAEANRYAEELENSQKADVYRLIMLARQNRPLFFGNDNQITFAPSQTHSLHNLSQLHWIRLAAEHLLASYSTAPDGQRGTLEDLKHIIADFSDIGFALKVMDPSVPDLHIKRFREANLFTFASNGDQFIDADEATSYIALLYSAASLSKRLREGADAVCPSLGLDNLGHNWIDPVCFRRELFTNYRSYWDHFPMLVRFYSNLSEKRQLAFQIALESAARRYGFKNAPVVNVATDAIASVDIDGFAGIVQYVETIFARFDDNGDQILTLPELWNAYPVFKGSIAELGKLNPNGEFLLRAVFTYMLKFGHAPTQDVWGIGSLIVWISHEPFWEIHANRLTLFKVIASIAVPEALPAAPQVPKPPTYEELARANGVSLARAKFIDVIPVGPSAPMPDDTADNEAD